MYCLTTRPRLGQLSCLRHHDADASASSLKRGGVRRVSSSYARGSPAAAPATAPAAAPASLTKAWLARRGTDIRRTPPRLRLLALALALVTGLPGLPEAASPRILPEVDPRYLTDPRVGARRGEAACRPIPATLAPASDKPRRQPRAVPLAPPCAARPRVRPSL